MCGIAGWIGATREEPLEAHLLHLLERLEYRGYDSAGMWSADVGLVRCVGPVGHLKEKIARQLKHNAGRRKGQCTVPYGIAHTRWATHGKALMRNTHPHRGCRSRVFVVHNGVIENAEHLRAQHPCTYRSDTDTEVIAHLIEEEWCSGSTLEEAVRRTLQRLQGSYAIAVVSPLQAGTIVVARNRNPLLVACGRGWCAVASDALALAPFARSVAVLPEGEAFSLTHRGIERGGSKVRLPREVVRVGRIRTAPEEREGERPHAMYREILESPLAWHNAVLSVGDAVKKSAELRHILSREGSLVWFPAACGSAWYATMAAGKWFMDAGDCIVPLGVREAARAVRGIDLPKVVVAVSQSGETADTREAVRAAQEAEVSTIGVINVVPSSLAREVDVLIPMQAGQEVSVASTKAVVGQVGALVALAHARAALREGEKGRAERSVLQLASLADVLATFIREQSHRCAQWGSELAAFPSVVFIGSGPGEALAREGALKFKEITYRFAEGMHASELKHGPLALLDEKVPVVVILLSPQDTLTLTNAYEAKARGAPVFVIAPREAQQEVRKIADEFIALERGDEVGATATALVALHRIAYEAARVLGRPIDRPRNLAKSVTVQ